LAWLVPALCPAEGVAGLAADEAVPVALAALADAGGLFCGWLPVPVAAIDTLPWVPALGGVGGRPLCVRNGIIA
jgi:hypothetical protein